MRPRQAVKIRGSRSARRPWWDVLVLELEGFGMFLFGTVGVIVLAIVLEVLR